MKGLMKVLGVLTWVGGAIAGIVFARQEVTHGYYYTYTTIEFSIGIAVTYWIAAFVSGCLFFSMGVILQNQEQILANINSIKSDTISRIEVLDNFLRTNEGPSEKSNAEIHKD